MLALPVRSGTSEFGSNLLPVSAILDTVWWEIVRNDVHLVLYKVDSKYAELVIYRILPPGGSPGTDVVITVHVQPHVAQAGRSDWW
jgi:hypothetical protein